MEAIELEASLQQLDTLARKEYHASLTDVVTRPDDCDERRLFKIGRLLGVILKEPFAEPEALDPPSSYSGAYRAWNLKPEVDFEKAQSCWQYRALEALRSDPEVIQRMGGQLPSVYELARMAQTERGFFWFLAMSCRRYLCRDPELRSQIEREVQTAKRSGIDIKNVTPEVIAASGALQIAESLFERIPALGMTGAVVTAGLVFIIYNIGIDAFCRWASDHESYHDKFPNPDKEETSGQS
jgi:hypothetical protein